MVDISSMTLPELVNTVQAYPWFTPARAALCDAVMLQSGKDAGESSFRDSIPYLPDAAYVARKLRSTDLRNFSDEDLALLIRSAIQQKPAIVMVGGDYFSSEDYDNVRMDSDSSISRIAVVDYDAPDTKQQASQEQEITAFVSETLAEIYVAQEHPEQAIEIYRKLSLDNPEKSAYFASLIDKLMNIKYERIIHSTCNSCYHCSNTSDGGCSPSER